MSNNKNYYAVIMAGGIGSRFWPVSTQEFPKQFHDMLGTGQSLLQKTFSRLEQLVPSENILVLTNERYLDLTLAQLPAISKPQIVLEPAMRNTAPCILLAALKIQKKNPNAVMLVAPSDHWIEDEAAFVENVTTCFENCLRNDVLMTLGIIPTFPNTGYGYIDAATSKGSSVQGSESTKIRKVNQFREKPDYETAKQFIAAGNYLWNAGIFIWSVKSIAAAFDKYLPEMSSIFKSGESTYNTEFEQKFVAENYGLAENISIDYGILEKATNVYVLDAMFDWNDLGTWGDLHDKLDKDEMGNAMVRAETLLKGAHGNMIFTENDKLVVIDGLSDYIVVEKEQVLMIFPKKKEQEIKTLLAEISEKHGNKYT